MNSNFYWSVYKNIEKEVLELTNHIHFDDNQINIYSMKMAELLIRTVVEIESISKELYFLNDGEKANDNNLFFDTDCLDLLENKWRLSKKQVLLTSTNFHFTTFKTLTPLKKANKRGSSSSKWQQAYQGIKHNRNQNFQKGNIKNLLEACGALYLLNLYYKNETYPLEKDIFGDKFDNNLGSNIFSIKINKYNQVSFEGKYPKNEDYENTTYLIQHTDESYKDYSSVIVSIGNEIDSLNELEIPSKLGEISEKYKNINYEQMSEDLPEEIKKIAEEISFNNQVKVMQRNYSKFNDIYSKSKYEAVLNKNQY